jgi:hypothetical protein
LAFKEKKRPSVEPPRYGLWKNGDPLKSSYNKCIGARNGTSEEAYLEEGEHYPIVF